MNDSFFPALTTLFRNDVGLLSEHPTFVQLTWYPGLRAFPAFEALLAQLLGALQTKRYLGVLVQQQLMVPYSPEEFTYLSQQWIPRAVLRSSYRYVAVVLPADLQAYVVSVQVRAQVSRLPLVFRTFEQLAAAQTWLEQVGK